MWGDKDLHVKIAEKGGMMSITSPTTTINKKKTTSKDKKVTVGKKKALKK
jgi:flagellar motor switch protein FliM